MARRPVTDSERETYEVAKQFVRKLGQESSRKLDCKVTFKLHRAYHTRSRYEYDESADGEEKGRITVVVRGKRAFVMNSFVFSHVVKRALRNLNAAERIKMTKTENKWKGAYS